MKHNKHLTEGQFIFARMICDSQNLIQVRFHRKIFLKYQKPSLLFYRIKSRNIKYIKHTIITSKIVSMTRTFYQCFIKKNLTNTQERCRTCYR